MDKQLMAYVPLFMGLTEDEQETLTGSFSAGQLTANGLLFKAGSQSEALYLLEQGFVRLTTESGQNLATLGPGSLLGDAALLGGSSNDVSAVAVSELKYSKLTDRQLRELMLQEPAIGLRLSQNFGRLIVQMQDYLVQTLSRTNELSSLPAHTLQAIAQQLQPRALRAQEILYRVGDQPGGLYVIERGAFEVRPEGTVTDQAVTRVQSGAILGALAMLTNKPYTSTVAAVEDSLLWTLPLAGFQTINSRHPGLRRSLVRNVRARLSRADQTQAAARLGQMPIFGELPPASMQAIAARMVLQHVPAGERVYRVGEIGDALYLIESGEIEQTEENASGVVEEKARIGVSGFFGEMSLLTGMMRTEDATATRNTNLWVLYKSDLDDLTAQHPAISKALSQGLASRLASSEAAQNEERFRDFPLLADLNPSDLRQVAGYLRPTRYRAGEHIYRASSPADTLFLLERGNVRVQPLSGGNWQLGPGETFGERALLTNQPHNSSVIAESDVDVWTLNKRDFEALMNRYPSIAINLSRMISQHNTQPNSMAPAGPMLDEQATSAAPAVAESPARWRRAQAIAGTRDTRERLSFGTWFANLSAFAKLRLVLLILLLIWLIGIAAPLALLRLLGATSVASGASLAGTRNALAAVLQVGSYDLATTNKSLAMELARADSLVPPTPPYTPAPTPTPASVVAPLMAPKNVAASAPVAGQFISNPEPGDSFVVEDTAQVAPTAEEGQVTASSAPSAPSRTWDSRLDGLGVTLEEAPVGAGQQYWKLIDAQWWDEQQSGGKHHIYVEVLDENGNRIVGQPVTVWWSEGSATGPTEDKAPPDYGYNYQMYAAGQAYNVKVEGLPSDMLHGAGMGSLEQRTFGIHTTYLLTYRKTTK